MITVDVYPFLAFSDLTCHLQDTGIGIFWLQCCIIVRRPNLEETTHEASPSAGKNTGVVLVPCCAWKSVLTAISSALIFPRSLVICYDRWVLSKGHQSYYKCLMNSQPTFLFFDQFLTYEMAILSKGHKQDNFEPHNPLTLSFTNTQGFCLKFVGCKSFLKSNSPDILVLCETSFIFWTILMEFE